MLRMTVIAALLILPLASAQAQDRIRTLTPPAIKKFVESMAEKTKPGGRLSNQKVAKYLNVHLFDAGVYQSDIVFRIPGHDDQVRQISLGKEEFIYNVLSGRDAMKDYDASVAVEKIDIHANKQEARFLTITEEKGSMPLEGQYLPYTGKTECAQHLALDAGTPVILSAVCQSTLTFEEP